MYLKNRLEASGRLKYRLITQFQVEYNAFDTRVMFKAAQQHPQRSSRKPSTSDQW